MWDNGIISYVDAAKILAIEMGLETNFPEKRKIKKTHGIRTCRG